MFGLAIKLATITPRYHLEKEKASPTAGTQDAVERVGSKYLPLAP